MRASDFEISNYRKLDNILSKLCDMVVNGQKSDRDYGMVAAAILDPDNKIIARLNRPGKDGKRIHAEHAAIKDYKKKYGSIPKGSIILTTLSPCNEHMDERDGPSCTAIINNTNIEKVYCGYMDPTQDDDTRQFNIMETADKQIRNRCKKFADTFLDDVQENFADGQHPERKELDPDVYEDLDNGIIARVARQIVPTIRAKSTPEGYVYLKTADGLSLVIGCNIADGSIGINIGTGHETTSSGPHKGAITKIVQAVYAAAVKHYGTPSQPGSLNVDHDAGHGVWQHIAQKLGLEYAAHMVKENFADGKHPEDKGDSKRHGINTKASVSSLRKTAKQGGRKGQLAHWLANMKAGKKKH
jgi:pyrimidine deaminase RibD-like protein